MSVLDSRPPGPPDNPRGELPDQIEALDDAELGERVCALLGAGSRYTEGILEALRTGVDGHGDLIRLALDVQHGAPGKVATHRMHNPKKYPRWPGYQILSVSPDSCQELGAGSTMARALCVSLVYLNRATEDWERATASGYRQRILRTSIVAFREVYGSFRASGEALVTVHAAFDALPSEVKPLLLERVEGLAAIIDAPRANC